MRNSDAVRKCERDYASAMTVEGNLEIRLALLTSSTQSATIERELERAKFQTMSARARLVKAFKVQQLSRLGV